MNTAPSVALIEPPSPFLLSGYPVGLASIAAYLEARAGCAVRILDLQTAADPGAAARRIDEECVQKGIRVFGIRMLTPTYLSAKRTAIVIKGLAAGAVVIAGGPHASAEPERTLASNPAIDFVVIGEGERTFAELAAALRDGSEPSGIAGIAYRRPGGGIARTPARPPMTEQELGTLPFSGDRFLDHGRYMNNDASAIVVTSRGCPFQCSFCAAAGFWGAGRCRPRPVRHVIDELEYLVLGKKIRRIYFEDATFNFSKARVIELCEAMISKRRENPDFAFTWRPPCRADLLDGETLKKMKEAGCTDIFFGLETFDERQLRAIKGGVAATTAGYRDYLKKVTEVFDRCRETGIETIAAMILGLPYQTDESFRINGEALRALRPGQLTFSVLCLYAGAPLFHTYAREPGFEWLEGLLGREDVFEREYDDRWSAADLNEVSVHGPGAVKPRYVNKEVFIERGAVEHDHARIRADYDRYLACAGEAAGRKLSVNSIRSATAPQAEPL